MLNDHADQTDHDNFFPIAIYQKIRSISFILKQLDINKYNLPETGMSGTRTVKSVETLDFFPLGILTSSVSLVFMHPCCCLASDAGFNSVQISRQNDRGKRHVQRVSTGESKLSFRLVLNRFLLLSKLIFNINITIYCLKYFMINLK